MGTRLQRDGMLRDYLSRRIAASACVCARGIATITIFPSSLQSRHWRLQPSSHATLR
jgi:hypothetical protein